MPPVLNFIFSWDILYRINGNNNTCSIHQNIKNIQKNRLSTSSSSVNTALSATKSNTNTNSMNNCYPIS
eukprot:UN19579